MRVSLDHVIVCALASGCPARATAQAGKHAVDAGYTGLVTGLAALCQGRRPARRRTGEQRLRLRQGSRSITDSALEGREPERLSGSWISRGRRRLIGGRGRVLESRAGAGTSARLRTGIVWANSLAKQARCPNPARWSSAADDGIAGSIQCPARLELARGRECCFTLEPDDVEP